MQFSRAAVGALLLFSASFYFFAPTVFWFNFYRAATGSRQVGEYGVYRSLGCEVPGVGVTMTTYWHVYFTCDPGIPTGATAERVTTP